MIKHGIRDFSLLGEYWTVWAVFKADTDAEEIERFLSDTYNIDLDYLYRGEGQAYNNRAELTRQGSRILFKQDHGLDV